ncbi:hypothetical protein ACO1NA_14280, partial [Staphylococcus aureus]
GMAMIDRTAVLASIARLRRKLRASEAVFTLLAGIAGLAAGLLTIAQQAIAHAVQRLFYGVSINRLSALGSIHHPWKLIALPIGGVAM